jgi:uncharacterized protein DUF4153
MTWNTRRGLVLLLIAAGLGLLGDLILRAMPLGLNVGIFVAALVGVGVVGASIYLSRRQNDADLKESTALLGEGRWLAILAVLFAAAVAWRASTMLAFLNVVAALVALALLALRGRSGRIVLASLSEYAAAAVLAALYAMGGALLLLLGDVKWQEVSRTGRPSLVLAVLRGLAIALPLLLVFGALFVAADAAFGGIVREVLKIDLAAILGHVLLWGFLAWVAAGYLRQTLGGKSWSGFGLPCPTGLTLGGVEVGVALGLLDLLFLAFVAVQFRYLFGGAPLVEASANLTYAEYARRGFFELVAVVALALPLLLVADWARRPDAARRDLVVFRALAFALVAMLFLVMASAFQRMTLYQQAYGLTELRLYATAFMAWLALVVFWFGATALLGRRGRFAFGALVAGFVVLGCLNALNPDELIARTNLARVGGPVATELGQRPFDYQYTLQLSADAVPALVEGIGEMSPAARAAVARAALQRWGSQAAPSDWRSWNWGRWRAAETVRASEEALSALTR